MTEAELRHAVGDRVYDAFAPDVSWATDWIDAGQTRVKTSKSLTSYEYVSQPRRATSNSAVLTSTWNRSGLVKSASMTSGGVSTQPLA